MKLYNRRLRSPVTYAMPVPVKWLLKGDGCVDPFVIESLPASVSGNTSNAGADYSYSTGTCPGETYGYGKASSDHAYQLTALETGKYLITLNATYDGNLYVVSDCANIDQSCLAADDEVGTGKEEQVIVR